MSDGREERDELEKRREQEKRENREDRIDRGDVDEWETYVLMSLPHRGSDELGLVLAVCAAWLSARALPNLADESLGQGTRSVRQTGVPA
jgi:hypothetical protein